MKLNKLKVGQTKQLKIMNKKWEKEFDKEFTRSDGLIDKYSWYGTEAEDIVPQSTPRAIKQFISNLLNSQEKQHKKSIKLLTEIFDNKMDSLLKEQRESPMGVSQWKKHGKKHGYWEYFKKNN